MNSNNANSQKIALSVMPQVLDQRALIPILDAHHLRLRPVANIDQAARYLEKGNPAAVVITERYLPDGTWREVLALVRKYSGGAATAPVIVATANALPNLWIEVLDAGCADLVDKPFDMDGGEVELRQVLAELRCRGRLAGAPTLRAAAAGGVR
jgi:DNA-binding NtrC family response regulator